MRDLGALWRRRFLAGGDVTELDRAICYFRDALEHMRMRSNVLFWTGERIYEWYVAAES